MLVLLLTVLFIVVARWSTYTLAEMLVRKVDDLMRAWFGIVNGVLVLSEFMRIIEICSFSLTIVKPRCASAFTTLLFGASTGNFDIKQQPLFQQQKLPKPEVLFLMFVCQMF